MNLLINGIKGKMGTIIKEAALVDNYWDNIYGLARETSDLEDDVKVDVMIDFSHESSLDRVLDLALRRQLPLVIGTTGYSDAQLRRINEASKEIPILYATNMSLGMNLLFILAEEVASALKNSVDIEVVESHHNRKKDAPSGSAVSLVEAIEKGLGEKRRHQHGRLGECPRQEGEIGIHSLRAGNIVGYHEASFINELESIKISHEAYDRNVFGQGTLEAGKFIVKQRPGLYNMRDVLGI